ncbi:MAG: cytochrome c family protein [Chromatiaceae bacterium]|nr:cytochrome c family protein [Gammaproteobacteria bacterium]MCP5312959.1 cytochrome c family protein [Chromatiaceae bacterium]
MHSTAQVRGRNLKSAVVALAVLALLANTAFARDSSPGDSRRFPPSYITVEEHKDVTPEQWTDPRVCGQCHTRQYEGWNGSMHSNAFKDPVFQALWALAEKADPKLRNHCGACHTPIGVSTNTITFDPDAGLHGRFSAPGVAAKGVSCDVCHTISGTNLTKTAVLEHGNASFVMSPGNTKRATLEDAKSPYHETEYSEHHAKSDFCGNCHNIFHPGNNFPIERTYDEWKYSIYAQNGVQCQDCHMVPVEVAKKVADTLKRPEELDDPSLEGFAGLGGPWRKVVHKHGFVGGNAVVTAALNTWDAGNEETFGAQSNYQEAIARLQSAASLDIAVAPKSGPMHQLKIKVTNERAGHNLPTSLTEVREVWLEVVVTDDQGRELMRSGTLDEHNLLPKDTVIFNAHAVDENGQDTHLPWEIVRFVDVNTIPPKGYKYGKYYFNLPDDAKEIKVIARLHYRSFSQKLADLLLGKDAIKVPSVEMVSLEQRYPVSELTVADASDAGH